MGSWIIANGRDHEVGFAELRETNRRRLAALPKYTYLVSRTAREGEPPRPLETFSIAPLATRHYPDPALLASIRAQLTQRDGVPIADVLAEIAGRGPAPDAPAATATPAPRTFALTAEVAIGADAETITPPTGEG